MVQQTGLRSVCVSPDGERRQYVMLMEAVLPRIAGGVATVEGVTQKQYAVASCKATRETASTNVTGPLATFGWNVHAGERFRRKGTVGVFVSKKTAYARYQTEIQFAAERGYTVKSDPGLPADDWPFYAPPATNLEAKDVMPVMSRRNWRDEIACELEDWGFGWVGMLLRVAEIDAGAGLVAPGWYAFLSGNNHGTSYGSCIAALRFEDSPGVWMTRFEALYERRRRWIRRLAVTSPGLLSRGGLAGRYA